MNLGEKIASLRKKNNMTQAELGDALNVTYQAVSKWERGESLPDFDTISKISKLFQVPISYFEGGGENIVESAATASPQQATAEIIGMCVQCGKVVHEGEAAETTPKLICKDCAELNRSAEEQRKIDEENKKAAAEKKARDDIKYEKDSMKRTRKKALLISIIPAVLIFTLFLVLSLNSDEGMFTPIFVIGIMLTITAYTFTAQMIWDGTVREVCTGGGHVMSLPGIIFSLSPDGLLFLIVTKIFLGIVSAIVFVGSIIACVFASLVIAPFTFVPSLLLYNRKIRKVGK